MNFELYLEKQFKLHPSMQMQDIIKLCYQAVFGPEHMLVDAKQAKTYFTQEYEATPVNFATPLYEPLSDTFCRVNFSAWKAKELDAEKLFELFWASAKSKSSGTETDFDRFAKSAENMISKGLLPFSSEEWKEYFAAYKKSGMHPVHHSDAYRLAEHPAYRLVYKSLLNAVLPE